MQGACAVFSTVACSALQYFSTLSHNTARISKKNIEHKICVLIFSKRLSETFLIPRRNERDMIKKCVLIVVQSTRYSCPTLMKLEFSLQIFEKYSNTKIHKNPSIGSRVVPCGRTDMTKLIVAKRKHSPE
jgi:hypothetical protein